MRFSIADATGQEREPWLAVSFVPMVLVVALTLVAGVWLLHTNNIDSPSTPFDAVAWRAVADTSGPNPRGAMVHDLMRHHLPVGMARQEVEQLLGPPSSRETDTDWEYGLGPEIGGWLYMDGYTLDLRFGRDGRLLRTELTQH